MRFTKVNVFWNRIWSFSVSILECFGVDFGAFWGRFWSFLRVPRRILLRGLFLHLYWCLLEAHLSDFGGKMGPKMEPKIAKNLLKSSSEKYHIFYWLWDTIFFDLGSILEAFLEAWGPQKLVKRLRHPLKSWKSRDVTSDLENIRFETDFLTIFEPNWVPKSSQNREKSEQKKW